jgi:phenylalanyl-tRNA synthetase beta chain
MRKDLLPGLVLAAARNISRGQTDLALVEEGSVFLPARGHAVKELPVGNKRPSEEELAKLNASIPVQPRHLAGLVVGDWIPKSPTTQAIESGYTQAISAVETALRALGLSYSLEQSEIQGMHPGRGANVMVSNEIVGKVGELHPDLATENHLPRRVGVFEVNLSVLYELAIDVSVASEVSAMPALTQDLSLVVSVDISAQSVSELLKKESGELLESIKLVDEYQGKGIGEGKKSLTFAMVFRAKDKTLTQAEANEVKLAAVGACTSAFGAEIRA